MMSKFRETQKNVKKAAQKSMKEKRVEKRARKTGRVGYNKVSKVIEDSAH